MRKGQWSGWNGVRVVNGKLAQDSKPISPELKHHNIICEFEGIRFQSKLERDYYKNNLLPRYKRGQVKWFLLQVPFSCGGGVKYRADFLEVWADGSIHIIDCKGMRTQAFINKKKQVEALYPIHIQEVK